MQVTRLSLAAAVGLAVLAACAPGSLPGMFQGSNAASMPEPAEGATFFAANCTSCHGTGARGDGPVSGDLSPAPPDLTVLARGNGGAFPRARALGYIWGDPEQSHVIRVMPEFGQGMALDLVPVEVDGVFTPTPRALAGVLAYLESIQR